VVYFKAGRAMLWTEGAGSRSLLEASFEQVRISDDGQVVAFLGYDSAGVYGLHAINTDGANAAGAGQRLGEPSVVLDGVASSWYDYTIVYP
jgi:hypothetical protein